MPVDLSVVPLNDLLNEIRKRCEARLILVEPPPSNNGKFRALRKNLGITQLEAALMIGCTQAYISQIERGMAWSGEIFSGLSNLQAPGLLASKLEKVRLQEQEIRDKQREDMKAIRHARKQLKLKEQPRTLPPVRFRGK